MIERYEQRRISRVLAGFLLLFLGALFLLQNAGLIRAGRIGDYWPLLLVWIGLTRLLAPRRAHHFASGLVILVMGIALQLDRLGVIWLRLRDLWPVLLILAGGAMVAESFIWRRAAPPGFDPERRS